MGNPVGAIRVHLQLFDKDHCIGHGYNDPLFGRWLEEFSATSIGQPGYPGLVRSRLNFRDETPTAAPINGNIGRLVTHEG
jgi:hypothetical protein